METKFSISNNIIKGEVKTLHNIKHSHNLGSVFLNLFKDYGQKVAQINVETREERTFETIKDRSVRCALWLKKEHIGSGDVVSVCTYNQLDACIPILATLYNGAVFNPWHHELTLDSAQYFLRLVEPKIIFSCESAVDILMEASKLENRSVKIIVFGTHTKVKSFAEVINSQSEDEVKQYKPRTIDNPLDIALILFSSGTSGSPKAVTHCYKKIVDNLLLFTSVQPKIALWYSGLCWISGTYLTLRSLLIGSVAILHSSFNVDTTFTVLKDFKVEWMFTTSQMLSLTNKKNALKNVSIDSLKAITAGGTKINPDDLIYFKKHCPNTALHQVYGLTESGSTITWHTEKNDISSIGYLAPNQQLKIVDTNTGKALGPNQQGEIVLKPSGLTMGYLNNPTATKETIDEEGWMHTGDLGHYNEKGEIFLTDRLKEVMKYCGHHVAPSEIENLLLTHPAVLEVAVVPVPHDLDYERPMAFVKKYPGAEVAEKELVEMSSKLGKHKMLHGGVKFLDNLPRTASGKVRRLELKNMAKNYKI